MPSEREELIQELDNSGCPVCRDCHILESVDKYIKSEKRLLLEKIGNALDYSGDVETGWTMAKEIVEANLAIIEKEGSV